ncbi:hypothetical protein L1987_24667 [Smallanthus sonchifolius]|uniref:Uncharacterized protein n=1 Tax=Smallanthus sonchifolius TaxID=185202 RepID=A0ACB9IL09_9ASTR|nr:hypothetical protein L1987_24667 [Smallanthus sonchifolius]
MPPRRDPQHNETENTQPDLEQLINQGIDAAIPRIVAQITAGLIRSAGGTSGGASGSGGAGGGTNTGNTNRGCTFKDFSAGKTLDFYGSEGAVTGNTNRGCTFKDFSAGKTLDFYGSEGAVGIVRWIEKMESVIKISNCLDNQKVKYAACSLQGEALTWWNSQLDALGEQVTDTLTWDEFKKMLIEEYCPRNEIKNIEVEFWNLEMEGAEILVYTTRFQELSHLVPHLVTPESKRIERYIWGLVPQIRGMVTSAKPSTMQSAIQLASELTDEMVRNGILVKKGTIGKKPKEKAMKKSTGGPSKKRKFVKNYVAVTPQKRANTGNPRLCAKCNSQHFGACEQFVCAKCKRVGHTANYCRFDPYAPRGCFECGATDHFRNKCPKLGRIGGNAANQAKGRAFVIGAADARQDPNVTTGTFLVNDLYASILFDTGADKSFISSEFRSLIKLKSQKLKEAYTIELANGKLIKASDIIRGCSMNLNNHQFNVDLIPIELGSFDVVIGMDWLSENRAEIVCSEKMVRIPLSNGEVLNVQGDKPGRSLNIVSCMKAWKYLRKGSYAFLANVIEKKLKEVKIQDIPVVREYPKVFPEDLLGLPPP